MRYIFYLGTILLLSNTFAANPPKIIVATGKKNSTYNRMFKELGAACYSHAQWLEYKTAGSTRNYELIQDSTNTITADDIQADEFKYKYKRTDLAFVQYDLLELDNVIKTGDRDLRKEVEKILPSYKKGLGGRLQVFQDLHAEEVHLISRKSDSSPLKDRKKVASWGGSYITAIIIKHKLGLNYEVIEHANSEEALQNLENKEVDLILAVDGQPVKWIQELDSYKFKLIPIRYNKRLKNIYEPGTLNSRAYGKFIANETSTITVRNAIIKKIPVDKNLVNVFNDYKKCIDRVIPILANPNEKWKQVKVKR